jgi:hypothetical protein
MLSLDKDTGIEIASPVVFLVWGLIPGVQIGVMFLVSQNSLRPAVRCSSGEVLRSGSLSTFSFVTETISILTHVLERTWTDEQAMSELSAKSKTYTGGCHCGANRYTVRISPPLDDPEATILNCNCSICEKNGYLFAFANVADTKWDKGGLDAMTEYLFYKHIIKHLFCPTCGTSVYCPSNSDDLNPGTLAINVSSMHAGAPRSRSTLNRLLGANH